jgi:hypothetical protein
VDSKSIIIALPPVNNYLAFEERMTRDWDNLPITIDARRIGGKFKKLLPVEEDR